MSKASLLGLSHDEKMYKVILFPVPDGVSDEGAEMAATYNSIISTVKMQGRSAWEYLGKFFTKSLIKRIESSLLEFLSVKTLSNIFNGCRDFFSLRPDNFSCQRVQPKSMKINRIGNMPTSSISENNKSLLLNCRAKKMYENV